MGRTVSLVVLTFALLQVGGGSGRSFHTHQASLRGRGGLVSQTPQRGDGPSGGGSSHLCPDGPGHAEIPENHTPAGLPQHGEHPHTPAVLYHTQHDAQGEFTLFVQTNRPNRMPTHFERRRFSISLLRMDVKGAAKSFRGTRDTNSNEKIFYVSDFTG